LTFFLSFKNVKSCFLKCRIVFWGPKHQNLNFLLPKMFLEFNSTHLRYFFFLLFVKMLNRVKMSLSVFLSSFLSFSDGRNWRNFMFFSFFLTFFFFLSFYMQLHATICFFRTWDSSVQHCLFSVYPCLHSKWILEKMIHT
jgi:hypothetical protein